MKGSNPLPSDAQKPAPPPNPPDVSVKNEIAGTAANVAATALSSPTVETRGSIPTWQERLNQIRSDLKFMSIECIKGDDIECAQALIVADLTLCEAMNKLSEYGIDDAPYEACSCEEVAGMGAPAKRIVNAACQVHSR